METRIEAFHRELKEFVNNNVKAADRNLHVGFLTGLFAKHYVPDQAPAPDKQFRIYQKSNHTFDFMNRVRILLGKSLNVHDVITVDKECKVIRGESLGVIDNFFPNKKQIAMERSEAPLQVSK
jgi:hypothetical protein